LRNSFTGCRKSASNRSCACRAWDPRPSGSGAGGGLAHLWKKNSYANQSQTS
jgi:hypothetical protein